MGARPGFIYYSLEGPAYRKREDKMCTFVILCVSACIMCRQSVFGLGIQFICVLALTNSGFLVWYWEIRARVFSASKN